MRTCSVDHRLGEESAADSTEPPSTFVSRLRPQQPRHDPGALIRYWGGVASFTFNLAASESKLPFVSV